MHIFIWREYVFMLYFCMCIHVYRCIYIFKLVKHVYLFPIYILILSIYRYAKRNDNTSDVKSKTFITIFLMPNVWIKNIFILFIYIYLLHALISIYRYSQHNDSSSAVKKSIYYMLLMPNVLIKNTFIWLSLYVTFNV
jgi:chromate transport protein ChrA